MEQTVLPPPRGDGTTLWLMGVTFEQKSLLGPRKTSQGDHQRAMVPTPEMAENSLKS